MIILTCVVYDDHGNRVGVLTMEDILETIPGQDIVDETDDVSNLRHHARQLRLKRIRRSCEGALTDRLPKR